MRSFNFFAYKIKWELVHSTFSFLPIKILKEKNNNITT